MKIQLSNIGKRFHREWIFKNINIEVAEKKSLAIVGTNGSGKSTLLQIASGITVPTLGTVSFFENNQAIDIDQAAVKGFMVAPYQELIEEMTLHELLQFHFSLLHLPAPKDQTFAEYCGISRMKNKEIRNFSSGMKQRVKLGLAFTHPGSALYLDEPTSTLDNYGVDWYNKELKKIHSTKTLVIASNIPEEYVLCDSKINILDYIK
jgi:ABC-type multidrug transport system ATPase subunit